MVTNQMMTRLIWQLQVETKINIAFVCVLNQTSFVYIATSVHSISKRQNLKKNKVKVEYQKGHGKVKIKRVQNVIQLFLVSLFKYLPWQLRFKRTFFLQLLLKHIWAASLTMNIWSVCFSKCNQMYFFVHHGRNVMIYSRFFVCVGFMFYLVFG